MKIYACRGTNETDTLRLTFVKTLKNLSCCICEYEILPKMA